MVRSRYRPLGLTLLALLAPAAARAQDSPDRFFGRPIASVRFETEGRPEPSPAVAALVTVHPGDPYRPEAVRESIVHLYNVGRYDDVTPFATDAANGAVDLLFKLTPRHPIDRLEFREDTGLSGSELDRRVKERYGGVPTRADPNSIADVVKGLLVDEGYLDASVTATTEQTHDPDRATLVLTVHAGARAAIAHADVQGTSPYSAARIVELTSTADGKPYRNGALLTAMESLRDDLRQKGYYTATASLASVTRGPRGVALVLRVEAGPRVTVTWTGDPKPAGDIEDYVPLQRESSADEDLLEDSDRRVKVYWERQGYKNATVTHAKERKGDELVITFHTEIGLRYRIGDVRLTGNAHMADALIREALGAARGAPYDPTRIDAGLLRVKLAYLRLGYYQVKVEELDPEEVAGSRTASDVNVVVRIEVSEGPEVQIGAVTITIAGKAVVPEAEVRAHLHVKTGAPLVFEDLLRDRAELQTLYRNRGFENAAVGFAPTLKDPRTMDVAISVTEGPQILVGHIEIVGNTKIKDSSVLELLTLRVGQPYGEADRVESRRRVLAMEVFRQVTVTAEPLLSGETMANVIVTVEELPNGSRSFGGGLEASRRTRLVEGGGVEDFLKVVPRGSFQIGRRNLWGKNRALDFFSRIALQPPSTNDPLTDGRGLGFSEYLVSGTYREPHAFHSNTDVLLAVSSEQAIRSTFNFIRKSGTADFVRRLTPHVSLSGRYALQYTKLFDTKILDADRPLIDRRFPQVRLSILSTGGSWDCRNDPVSPVRGTWVTLDGELATRALGSQVGYIKMFTQASGFHQIASARRIVLAGRAELGIARGFAREVVATDGSGRVDQVADLPASQRFFAGGGTSVRGFQLDRLGVPDILNPDGLSNGGNGVVVLNAEVRVGVGRLFGRELGVVGFTDAGNVFAKAADIDFSKLRTTVGFGARYDSYIGPIRFDFGFKTDRRMIGFARERGWEFHFSIGEAF